MKTRAKKSTTKSASQGAATSTKAQLKTLETPDEHPPHVFILPKQLSSSARIVTLPSPATSTPCRYLICPERGCHEFTRIAALKKACKSWLLAPNRGDQEGEDVSSRESEQGYVLQSPDLMIATPIDPLFIMLPALAEDAQDGGRQFYLSLSDYLERLARDAPHLQEMLRTDDLNRLERSFEARMKDVCSSMDDGTETLYMLSTQKLSETILRKAEKIVKTGLPASMEDKFVKQPLAVPVLNIQREESEVKLVDEPNNDNSQGEGSEVASTTDMSQETQTSVTSTLSSTSTAATSISAESTTTGPAEDVLHLLRLRTALNFILQSYVPAGLRSTITSALRQSDSLVNFKPLDEHLAHLEQLKKEALALRSLSDNISRKRSAVDDDEAMERAEAKKRKKEEEDLKKKNMSRGVKQLEKADRSGMKSISSFFGKPVAKKS